jgi:hypothetical protein
MQFRAHLTDCSSFDVTVSGGDEWVRDVQARMPAALFPSMQGKELMRTAAVEQAKAVIETDGLAPFAFLMEAEA